MLYIESLEIDDHILDKIETRHGIIFNEVEGHVYRRRDMYEEAKKGCTSCLAK